MRENAMNERIRELADQAGFDAVSLEVFNIEQDLKKFADLIIRECFQVVDDYAVGQASKPENYLGESLNVSMNIIDAAWKIKEHFGVEE